jgi:hypothetical protein
MPSSHGPANAPALPSSDMAAIEPIRADFRMRSPASGAGGFTHRRMPRHGELGLDAPLKLATSLAPKKSGAFGDRE